MALQGQAQVVRLHTQACQPVGPPIEIPLLILGMSARSAQRGEVSQAIPEKAVLRGRRSKQQQAVGDVRATRARAGLLRDVHI